jgi:four helix bundle protein
MHRFHELKVYRKAIRFTKMVREVTKTFPRQEVFVLTSQSVRAADSIALNIAEGEGNTSKREFAKFIGYSIRFGYECVACSDIVLEQGYISEKHHQDIFQHVDGIIAMLVGLHKSLQR